MSILPESRTQNLVIQQSNDDLLIYDLQTNKVYCLNETAAKVWNSCNGKTAIGNIAAQLKIPEEIVFLSLETLAKEKLLINNIQSISATNNFTRRKVLASALKTAAALPLITSIVAPSSVTAQSLNACVPNGGVVDLSPQPDSDTCTEAYFTAERNGKGCCNKVTNIAFGSPNANDCFGICPGVD